MDDAQTDGKKRQRLRLPAPSWSREEDDALLRAWADVVDRDAKSLLAAFEAVCTDMALPERTRSSNSLNLRRRMFVRMYDIVCAFHERQQLQKSRESTGDEASAAIATEYARVKYSSDRWFELSNSERRQWYNSLNTRNLTYGEMTRETFGTVEGIIKRAGEKAGASQHQRALTHTQPRVDVPAGDGNGDATPSTKRKRSTTKRVKSESLTAVAAAAEPKKEDKSYSGCMQPHRYESAPRPKGSAEDEGAMQEWIAEWHKEKARAAAEVEQAVDDSDATESDDEVFSCSDDDGEIVPANNLSLTESGTVKESSDPVASDTRQGVKSASLDLLELVSILERQARHLGEMFHDAKTERMEESRSRRVITKHLSLDRDERRRALDVLMVREEELQRECSEWDAERSRMKLELARLCEQRAAQQQP